MPGDLAGGKHARDHRPPSASFNMSFVPAARTCPALLRPEMRHHLFGQRIAAKLTIQPSPSRPARGIAGSLTAPRQPHDLTIAAALPTIRLETT